MRCMISDLLVLPPLVLPLLPLALPPPAGDGGLDVCIILYDTMRLMQYTYSIVGPIMVMEDTTTTLFQ